MQKPFIVSDPLKIVVPRGKTLAGLILFLLYIFHCINTIFNQVETGDVRRLYSQLKYFIQHSAFRIIV